MGAGLYTRALFFFGGFAAMAFPVATLSPEVSLVCRYRPAWSSYVDVEAARGCGLRLNGAVGAVSRA